MESSKVYVDVVARFDKDGVMMPMAFVWEDGRKYEIEREMRQPLSLIHI